MATEAEAAVLRLLSAIEFDSAPAAAAILNFGNEGVTVLCDAALGTYPGLRPKVRLNAVALLDAVAHPQARETLRLLVRDADPDVSIRAVRAAARLRDEASVAEMARVLRQPELPPLVAAETVRALAAINSADARRALGDYEAADPARYPHRAAAVVNEQLRLRRR
jgi:HEAT repeat protein